MVFDINRSRAAEIIPFGNHLGSSGVIWGHLGSFGIIWGHLVSSEAGSCNLRCVFVILDFRSVILVCVFDILDLKSVILRRVFCHFGFQKCHFTTCFVILDFRSVILRRVLTVCLSEVLFYYVFLT